MPLRKFLAALLALMPASGLACSCIATLDLSEFDAVARAFESSDEVFSAEVEALSPEDPGDYDAQTARLRVIQAWKGPHATGDRLSLFSRNDPFLMSCLRPLQRGEVLVAYRSRRAGISICSRSGLLRDALPDLPALNTLARRDPADRLFAPSGASNPEWLSELLVDIYLWHRGHQHW